MHPQITRDAPGSCPICGMTLEPRFPGGEDENTELIEMKRRLWVSALLSLPLLAIGMGDFIPGAPLARLLSMAALPWIQPALASPVVLCSNSSSKSVRSCVSQKLASS
jgi:P-type Cu+ transporter